MKRIDLIYEKLKEWTAGENRWGSAKKLAFRPRQYVKYVN
ncbi:hypothetical protein PcaKH15_11960 [Parageobacillus caldoxylosilyticus]|nr:hypothetical protein PcaKH15_11960 [Parageobacillus caldoxylosilyticus]BDG39067.1 hypothetical protein PcaKH16_12060 [Parageobacillus caldoxylosilyticus]